MKKLANFRKVFALVVAILMVMTLMPGEALASSEIVNSGQMGDNVYWTLDTDGLLTMSGTGATWDYKDPWNGAGKEWQQTYRPNGRWVKVKKVAINEGITTIGKLALASGNYSVVEIPVSVEDIKDMAFWGCNDVTDIYYAGNETQWQQLIGNGADWSFSAVPNATIHYGALQVADEPSAWARAEVQSAVAVGLVPENLQQNYTGPVSRGEVAQMFINLVEKSSDKNIDTFMAEKGVSINPNAFSDTADKAVLAANALGIINGTGGGKFSPEGTLTRAQIAAIINRVAETLGVSTGGYRHSFTDVRGHWVDAELGWPVSAGVINGVGGNKFDPDTKLTTEQAIAISYRALGVLGR